MPTGLILGGLSALISPGFATCIFGLAHCGQCCGGFSWYIAGLVYRYKAIGKYAAGDSDEADYFLGEKDLIQE